MKGVRETFSRYDSADCLKAEADIAAYLEACAAVCRRRDIWKTRRRKSGRTDFHRPVFGIGARLVRPRRRDSAHIQGRHPARPAGIFRASRRVIC